MSYMNMQVLLGAHSDIESWMELVRKVQANFPGLETETAMEEHRQTVLNFMKDQRAVCIKDEGKIVGVLLFSRKHNMICFLAVDPNYRKRGIATALLKTAIENLDRTSDIVVTTFRENDEKGTAPRALYRKFGFIEGELIEELGYPNQRFILHP